MDASASTLAADFSLSSRAAAFVWFYMALIRGQIAKGFICRKRWIQGHGEAPHNFANRFHHALRRARIVDLYVWRRLVRDNVFPFCVPPAGEGWTGRYLWFLLDTHDVRTEFAPVAGKDGVMHLARDEDFLT